MVCVKKVRVSLSTLFRALGLETLKQQQEHFDKVMKGIDKPVNEETQALFDYGTTQEINAVATLVGKIIPVYYPSLVFREDGCNIVELQHSFAVISGDGSGVNGNMDVKVAFEFKCPQPGKQWITDVHYVLPLRYTTQILSQMAAKKCSEFGYLCFSPESSTFINGNWDESLWSEVYELTNLLYGQTDPSRPSKILPSQKQLRERLRQYASRNQFVAEFPSLNGIHCSCSAIADMSEGVFGSHSSRKDTSKIVSQLECFTFLDMAQSALQEAYQLIRRPAKEILVTVLSDLDRTFVADKLTSYAVPVHYALSGFSLTMSSVRGILGELMHEVVSSGLNLKVIAFDGQFLEIAVSDDNGRPLTLCKFMKRHWEEVQKLEKNEKLSYLLNMNAIPSIDNADILHANFDVVRSERGMQISLRKTVKSVPSPSNITRVLLAKDAIQKRKNLQTDDNDDDHQGAEILLYLPQHVIDQLDEDSINLIKSVEKVGDVSTDVTNHTDNPTTEEKCIIDHEHLLISLLVANGNSAFNSVSLDEFKRFFSSAKTINSKFTVSELQTMLNLSKDSKSYSKFKKADLVNAVSEMYGDSSRIEKIYSPRTLKSATISSIKKWNAEAINVAYAQCIFVEKLKEWENDNKFQDNYTLVAENGDTFKINKWYCQPSITAEISYQPIIDPHHLFVNNRARCCSKGMVGMGIYSDAWHQVAKHSKTNGTGLSIEIAKDLRDRQRNSFAQTTFSAKVEDEMKKNGNVNEANWCRLLRNWYAAIDEAGIGVSQRINWLLDMRGYLLKFFKLGQFPPPGAYVAGMPIAQFEGILTNVDRRLQLYGMVERPYNQRAVTSLDSETFFSAFQDYDPKGSGVLRADDIPVAMGAAVSLFNQRFNTNRTHHFDTAERKSKHPRRKSGVISVLGVPGKEAEGYTIN